MKTFFLHLRKQFKTCWNRIINGFKKLYIRWCGRPGKLKKAIREAKQLHKKDGRRYRVFFFGYKYRVWHRDDIRRQIKGELFKDGLKAGKDFDTICFFDTNKKSPSLGGVGEVLCS